MGFGSFFSSILGSKPREAPTQPAARPRRENHHIAGGTGSNVRRDGHGQESSKRVTALPTALPQATPQMTQIRRVPQEAPRGHVQADVKDNRRSRRFSLGRSDSRKRRSWFGGQPDEGEDVPPVPRLVQASQHERTGSRGAQQSTDTTTTTTNDGNAKRKSRRYSIGRALLGKEKETDNNDSAPPRRPSLSLRRQSSSKSGRVTVETLPPLPPMPISITQTSQPATSSLPANRRSRAGSIKSVSSQKRKSRGFWTSSNPADDSDDDVPPVPSLIRDHTPPESEDDGIGHARTTTNLVHTVSRGSGDSKAARPVSVSSRKSYVPKSAAKGFMNSTNPASEATRISYRKSFRIDASTDLVCLTDEQRMEWAKLMGEPHRTYEQPKKAVGMVDESEKFENAQALAALEFGIRS